VRPGAWKLLKLNPGPRNRLEQVEYELYDLGQDLYETSNLADVQPEIVEQLKLVLKETRMSGLRFMNGPED
jgi:hypothetical protein